VRSHESRRAAIVTIHPEASAEVLTDRDRAAAFERIALPHARAAFALARWLARDEHDAEDVVQEAYLRAFKYFESFHGTDARTWILSIVRNSFRTWREQRGARADASETVEELETLASERESTPEEHALRNCDREAVDRAIGALPIEFREVLVLRELEGLAYREIASVVDAPIGTVMSRLSRAREHLRKLLSEHHAPEASP
jgi:RNA polymerase sigma-70 factor (ECF subfamily)